MATFTTRADALAAYRASTDYMIGAGDMSKAQAFVSACLYLLSCPEEAEHGEGRTRVLMPVAEIRAAKDQALAWLQARGSDALGGASVGPGFFSMSDFRR